MNSVLAIFAYLSAHYVEIISQIIMICTGLIGIFLLIPGEQPEKFLQGVVDFLAKFSRK